MSGGHFDYIQYRIGQAADEVEQEILNNDKNNEWGHCNGFSKETLTKFKQCEQTLRLAEEMLQRVDWLISGDDSEETFHIRWKEKIESIENN